MDNKKTDRMGLIHALDILHKVRDSMECLGMDECVDAFNVVFEWINIIVILLDKIGGSHGE